MAMYRLVTPYAVGGIEVHMGDRGKEIVTLTAPIFEWMIGHDWDAVEHWIGTKGFTVEQLWD